MMVELRQLEYFVAVAEEANFTRAAERVHISQSGISAQVRRLEEQLGVELIDRSGRVATLTPAGAAALEHARAVIAAAAAVRQAVDEVTGLLRGRLVVGMVTACTVRPLFDALSAFHAAHPGVELSLLEDGSDRLIERVRSGEADLALIGAAAMPEGLEGFTVVSERVVAAVPADHPLARRKRITLADVAAHPVVCMPAGTGIRTVFDRGCAARGARPDIALEASAPSAVADLAGRGLGVAILSASMVDDPLRGLEIADLDAPALLALVWRATDAPALRELVRHCRGAFASLRPAP
jgi:DNA-binding transcriptional LysR family regulator